MPSRPKETELDKAIKAHGEKNPKAVSIKWGKKWMDYDEWRSTREAMTRDKAKTQEGTS